MRRKQAGYALLLVMLMAALILVALAVAVPRLLTQGKREREEELIFRGQQYQHAIGLYYKKLGRYPQSLDDLLRTNDRGFLRRPFRDPMTPDGQWRILGLGPGGALLGSTHKPLPTGSVSNPPMDTEPPAGKPPKEGPLLSFKPGEKSPYPIAGVASRSQDASIRVYDSYGRYYDWEFVYDPTKEAQRPAPGATAGQPENPSDKSKGGFRRTPNPGQPQPNPQL